MTLRVRAACAVAALLFCLVGSAFAAPDDGPFPQPQALQPAIDFWTRIYVDVGGDAGLVHDSVHLSVVYEFLDLAKVSGERARRGKVKARKRHWGKVLARLASGKAPRDDAERVVVELFAKALRRKPTAKDLREAKKRLRYQRGQRDHFRGGLIRAGAYEAQMRKTFKEMGLPEDLAHLPHVESSFNTWAHSKSGAVGIWQFMRTTGRNYLTIDTVIDERRDPKRATRAAARLLRDNYSLLGNWPLAITAYNHGPTGMRRAKRKLGTSDIATIVEKYRSRRFGFASRNFYVQFLTVRKILRDRDKHFSGLKAHLPQELDVVKLPFYASIKHLELYLGITRAEVERLNPSLRESVMRGDKRVPKGFELRLPSGTVKPTAEKWLAAIPKEHRYDRQPPSPVYTVRRGDSLAKIAKRRSTSVSALVALNGLKNRNRIFPGQKIRVPERHSDGGRRRAPKPASNQAITAPAAKSATNAATAVLVPASAPPAPVSSPEVEALAIAVSRTIPPLTGDAFWNRIDGEVVLVGAEETLGHFSAWLDVSIERLRKLNKLSKRRSLRMGQRFKVDLSKVTAQQLLDRRMEHHQGVARAFLDLHQITGTVDHTLRRGENLWILSNKVYSLPAWLIHRYNPDTDMSLLRPGKQITIPVVQPITPS